MIRGCRGHPPDLCLSLLAPDSPHLHGAADVQKGDSSDGAGVIFVISDGTRKRRFDA
jgi:hypothetical protein